MNVVIYARFSSNKQTEQSIEGQIAACTKYANEQGFNIIGHYIDRAKSATTDRRPNFQRMIKDSAKKQFEAVLVYRLDRFARNRYDSANYKQKLKKNGVNVLSVTEHISSDPEGIILEAMLEGYAEYYSAELSKKVKRGHNINAEKYLSNGSQLGLGLTVDKDKKIVVDHDKAPFVKLIFERYVGGSTIREIIDELEEKGIKTPKGKAFTYTVVRNLLKNKRYIGYYIYDGEETPGIIEPIIDESLFNKAQERLERTRVARTSTKAHEEYILTSKLYCGKCKRLMTGISGTGATQVYHYYVCNGKQKKRLCNKKNVQKRLIEDIVVNKCRTILTDDNIAIIAKAVAARTQADYDNSIIRDLEKQLKENKKAIDNLLIALETGQAVDVISNRIAERTDERKDIERKIAAEKLHQIVLDESDIIMFLKAIKNGDIDDLKYRRLLVNVFVNRIYLFDDKYTIIFNVGGNTLEVTETLLEDIKSENADFECSHINKNGPPKNPSQ